MDEIYMSINNAAAAIGVGRSTVYMLIGDGRLVAVRIGRRTLVSTSSIRALGETALVRKGGRA